MYCRFVYMWVVELTRCLLATINGVNGFMKRSRGSLPFETQNQGPAQCCGVSLRCNAVGHRSAGNQVIPNFLYYVV